MATRIGWNLNAGAARRNRAVRLRLATPVADSAAPFGWRYGGSEAFDAAARVTPLAAPDSSLLVSRLLP